MICYVLAVGKQHLGPHVVVGYGTKIFWPFHYVTRSPGEKQRRCKTVVVPVMVHLVDAKHKFLFQTQQ